MTKPTIEISLDRGDKAGVINANERFQPDAYERVATYLDKSLKSAENSAASENNAADYESQHIHNAIFVDGARGTGKTAFILSLRAFMRQRSTAANKIHFCLPVDPTLLNDDESFLNVVIAKLHDEVKTCRGRDGLRNDDRNCPNRTAYFDALEKVTRSLEGLEGKDQAPGMERVLANRNSLGLDRHLNDLIREACKILGCSLVVLPIDDVDMAPHRSYGILEVIRRHLAYPQIVPVVIGDFRQYSHIVSTKLEEQLKKSRGAEYPMLDDLKDQYLNKVLPVHRRVHLLTVPEIIDRYDLVICTGKYKLSFVFFQFLFKHIIYARTNGTENSHPPFLPDNVRDLIQWLQATAPLLFKDKVFLIINIDAKTDEPTKDVELRAVKLSRVLRESTDREIRGLFIEIIDTINDYWKNKGRWPDYYRGEADRSLSGLGPEETTCRPLFDLIWFDALRHPKDKSIYPWHIVVVDTIKRAANRFQDDHALGNTLVAFPPLEPYSRHAIFSKNTVADIKSKQCRFLTRVFSHGNYYSSYQTTSLIFFGKAFEIIVTSLLGKCSKETLSRIMRDPPFHSFFSAFSTRTLETEVGEAGEDAGSTETDHGEYLQEFADDVKKWHETLGTSRPSAQLIQKAMNKAFTMFIQLKLRGGGGLGDDSLFTVGERFRRIMLNAFASFEKSVLDGDGTIVFQNVALEPLKNSQLPKWENDASYRFNVNQLLGTDSVTDAISKHPLFELLSHDEVFSINVSSTIKAPVRPNHLRAGIDTNDQKPKNRVEEAVNTLKYTSAIMPEVMIGCQVWWEDFYTKRGKDTRSAFNNISVDESIINNLNYALFDTMRDPRSNILLGYLKDKRKKLFHQLTSITRLHPDILSWLNS